MIINHSKKFVFIHVPKTGGTSVQTALLSVPDSRIPGQTKHWTANDLLRSRRWWHRPLDGYVFFAFVRNPWDRFLSLHRYLRTKPKYQSRVPAQFASFVALLANREPWLMGLHSIHSQSDFVVGTECKIGRYESLGEDFAAISASFGLKLDLPRLNVSATSKVDYRQFYSDVDAEVIGSEYEADLKRFGYAFDPGAAASTQRASVCAAL
ncbi:sulfotransferase family 2 domain-containing protein [Ensifer aridi]|uniref:sulfotransferase family 2 domain-containing protein n=1 Tax=Ensifer aridi TaxID=1708715 RepID=UPI001555F9AE|nr:sulfotransferase family 2 domain-containing protein [Ensifer aridi]